MKDKIIKLFRKYGFEYRANLSDDSYLAFTYKSGFFHNAELVSLDVDNEKELSKKMQKSAEQLDKMGFSTKKSFYRSLKEAEESLFNGFFNVKEWKGRIKEEYKKHCENVLSVLPGSNNSYEYINVPYLKNNREVEQSSLIKDVCDSLNSKGPMLTIIEAPAGFGKTCTSFEIINELSNSKNGRPLPFFTEFSRDRQARVFSHIFVREVDKAFSSVNSELVIEEVKDGKVAVVLDGFDEILHDGDKESDDLLSNFENAEPMLETIGELLTNNAKVILTSRRSAIFEGKMFNEWVNRYKEEFEINRYRLQKPEIKDWITVDRYEALSKCNLELENLANPVLLSFIRYSDEHQFQELQKQPNLIVNQYFTSMLEREQDRQQLLMTVEQQEEFLKTIAADMCENNYTSDTKEKLILTIKEKAGNLISEVRKLYSPKERPSIDKLATTLSNHAFFDRSSKKENHIEFINEFVLGNYIAMDIFDASDEWIASDERFVEPAVLSYVPRAKEIKSSLWEKLQPMKVFLDSSSIIRFELLLTGNISSNYSSTEITSVDIENIEVTNNLRFENTLFNDCTFRNVLFESSALHNISFLNCKFWDCEYINEDSVNVLDLNFFNCITNNSFLDSVDEISNSIDKGGVSQLTQIEKYLLDKIWPVGRENIERLHFFVGQIIQSNKYSKKEMMKAIRELRQKGYFLEANNTNFIKINHERLGDIKKLLGRI